MPYLDVEELKAQLGIVGNDKDAELSLLIGGVEVSIKRYLGFDPASAPVTEYYEGNGQHFFTLLRQPVTSVTSVYLDHDGDFGKTDSFVAGTLLVAGIDYTVVMSPLGAASIYKIDGFWPLQSQTLTNRLAGELVPNHGCIRVTYTAGGGELASVAKYAGMMECAARWAMRLNGLGLMQSESFDGRSISLTPWAPGGNTGRSRFVSPLVETVLSSFAHIPFA